MRGFKVFPELIEAELIKHPEVEAAYCTAVGDGSGDDTTSRLEAAVYLSSSVDGPNAASAQGLRQFMTERVPAYMVPVAFKHMGSRNASTADLAALDVSNTDASATSNASSNYASDVEPVSDSDAPAAAVPRHGRSGKRPGQQELANLMRALPDLKETNGPAVALSPAEAKVAAVWASVLSLKVETFSSPSVNFFDYGGSLAFFQLAKGLKESPDVGVGVPVGELLKTPTLEKMAAFIFSPRRRLAAEGGSAADAGGADADASTRAVGQQVPDGRAARAPRAERGGGGGVSAATLEKYRAKPSKAVLVTGCTGYVGAFPMESAGARRDDVSRVYALTRARTSPAPRSGCARRASGAIDGGADFEDGSPRCSPSSATSPAAVWAVGGGLRGARHVGGRGAARGGGGEHAQPAEAPAPTNVGGTSPVLALAALASLPVLFTSTIMPLDGAKPTATPVRAPRRPFSSRRGIPTGSPPPSCSSATLASASTPTRARCRTRITS